jgi:hypothetical protein
VVFSRYTSFPPPIKLTATIITEKLLKVALNTINVTLTHYICCTIKVYNKFFASFIHNKVWDFDKNLTQLEIRVNGVRDNESLLYCVYPAMSKSLKKLLKKAETRVVPIVSKGVLSPFYAVTLS